MGASRTYRTNSSNYAKMSVWNNTTGSNATLNLSDRQALDSLGQSGSFLTDTQQAYEHSLRETEDAEKKSPGGKESKDSDNTSGSMRQLFSQFQATQNVGKNGLSRQMKQMHEIRHQTMNYLMYLLFGDKAKKFRPFSEISLDDGTASNYTYVTDTTSHTGGKFYAHNSYVEQEQTSFSSAGKVVTADGREIDFQVDVAMSRSFMQAFSGEMTFGEDKLVDPLVINLNTGCASVTDQKFFFDLDADGTQEEISQLAGGSGYLALDKNGDGIVNDGNELFGTKSGNGFADLAAYDEDGNGWIDEADSIFSKLRVWTKDADGTDHLYGLGESGVGAIYLGSSDTEFSQKDVDNNTNAVIRKTGIFLYENGNVGTLQQMDLAT